MKYFKKITALIMSVIICFSMVACGSTDRNKAAKDLKLGGPVTVNVWYNDSAYESYLLNVAKEFHAANELVTINPMYVESEDYIETIYNESVKNGNAADVYLMSSEESEKAYLLGLMLENDTYKDIYNSDVYGNAGITACSYKNKLYGYPVSFNTTFMIYNKKYASAISTFSELQKINDSYVVTDDNQDVEMIFAWDPSSMFLNYTFGGKYINVGGNSAEEEKVLTVNDDKLKEAMTEYVKLKELYAVSRKEVDMNKNIDLFAKGGLMYSIIDANSLSVIDSSEVSYGICAVPKLTDNLENKSLSVTTMAVVNPYTSNIAASKAVARAISYDYADELEEKTGYLCARGDYKKTKNQEAYEELHRIYSDSSVKAKYIGVGELYIRYEIMLHQIWDGTDVDTAYGTFHNAVEHLKEDQNKSATVTVQ